MNRFPPFFGQFPANAVTGARYQDNTLSKRRHHFSHSEKAEEASFPRSVPINAGIVRSPTNGDEIDPATTKNIKWIAKLGSQSYGNVTVGSGHVFVGTNNDAPRDPS